MIHSLLEQIGISPVATTIYLASLKLGEATISEIARAVHLPRSSVKRHIDALVKRGLLNFFVLKKHKVIAAETPEKVRQMLNDKISNLDKVLQKLSRVRHSEKYHPRVFVYEGVSEIKKIYNDILAEQRPIDAITSPDDTYKVLGRFFDDFIQSRMIKKIPLRLLAPVDFKAIKFKRDDDKFLRKTKLLKQKMFSHIASYIYGNKVAIISLRDPGVSGVIIDDPIIADALRASFEMMWNCECSTLNKT